MAAKERTGRKEAIAHRQSQLTMKTQLCLLSGELMPNVIGVLYQKSERVIPIITEETRDQLPSLQRAIAAAGHKCEFLDPASVKPFNSEDCADVIRAALKDLPETVVNWTGGTKFMSYAARQVGQELGLRRIYVNTFGRQVLIDGIADPDFLDLAALGVNVLVHLFAAGHQLDQTRLQEFRAKHTPPEPLVEAAYLLFDMSDSERSDIRGLAAPRAVRQPYHPKSLSREKLDMLENAKLIQRAPGGGDYLLHSETLTRPFHFVSPQAANGQFLNSTYVEVFVWSHLKKRGAFDDVAWHVTINPGRKGRISEFDVLVAHDGRLFSIDCKAGMKVGTRLSDEIAKTASSCRRVGRLLSRWMLYVNQDRADFADQIVQMQRASHLDYADEEASPEANSEEGERIIGSQEARAKEFSGSVVWRDDVETLHKKVDEELRKIRSFQ